VIALVPDNDKLEGALVYQGGCLVTSGVDLETAAYISLATDARALAGDDLPEGTNRRGWWADQFDPDGQVIGSMLWLLEDAVATPENGVRAEQYAQDALKWMLDEGHVRAIDASNSILTDGIYVTITFTLLNGGEQTLSPYKVSA
jgi:phage gp46-like protein